VVDSNVGRELQGLKGFSAQKINDAFQVVASAPALARRAVPLKPATIQLQLEQPSRPTTILPVAKAATGEIIVNILTLGLKTLMLKPGFQVKSSQPERKEEEHVEREELFQCAV
jgi:hypothetical protein